MVSRTRRSFFFVVSEIERRRRRGVCEFFGSVTVSSPAAASQSRSIAAPPFSLHHGCQNPLSANSLCAQSRGCIGPWRKRLCRRWQRPPRQARKMRPRQPGDDRDDDGRAHGRNQSLKIWFFGGELEVRFGRISFQFERQQKHASAFLRGGQVERRPSRRSAARRD